MQNDKIKTNNMDDLNIKRHIKYGLKIKSLFDIDKYKNIKYIKQASGNIIITESGVYHIECIDDIFIEHNIINNIIHIIVDTARDDIKVNIKSHGEAININSDILHVVNINNKNIQAQIMSSIIVDGDTNIIYRSNIKSTDNATGVADQTAEFLNLSHFSKISAIPMIDVINTNVLAEHSLSIHNIDKNILFYLSLYGLSDFEIKSSLKQAFLEKKI